MLKVTNPNAPGQIVIRQVVSGVKDVIKVLFGIFIIWASIWIIWIVA